MILCRQPSLALQAVIRFVESAAIGELDTRPASDAATGRILSPWLGVVDAGGKLFSAEPANTTECTAPMRAQASKCDVGFPMHNRQ